MTDSLNLRARIREANLMLQPLILDADIQRLLPGAHRVGMTISKLFTDIDAALSLPEQRVTPEQDAEDAAWLALGRKAMIGWATENPYDEAGNNPSAQRVSGGEPSREAIEAADREHYGVGYRTSTMTDVERKQWAYTLRAAYAIDFPTPSAARRDA